MDHSELDQRYFIDHLIYNCPFCKRRHVSYSLESVRDFNWRSDKPCFVYIALCISCGMKSMHLSYENIHNTNSGKLRFDKDLDIDSKLFYSVPTSFFVLDERIPRVFRELIIEAEMCVKMNLLTGASACTRKAIYELTVVEKAEGEDYESKIKFLKTKYPAVPAEYFDVLCHIKDMTSDKVHEQSWDEWDNKHLNLFLNTLRAILHEIYVVPEERKKGVSEVRKLLESVKNAKQPVAKKVPAS